MKTAKYRSLVIMDPEGWNRKKFQYSFYEEEIDETEFQRRVSLSTQLFYEG